MRINNTGRPKSARLAMAALIKVPAVLSGGTPAGAGTMTVSIKQIVFPAPEYFVLNSGTDIVLFWWKIGGARSTPAKMNHTIRGPGIDGPVVDGHSETWDIRGQTLPIYNMENYGVNASIKAVLNGDELARPFSGHIWIVPAGTKPGTYYSRVEYYSAEACGERSCPGQCDAVSEVAFEVQ